MGWGLRVWVGVDGFGIESFRVRVWVGVRVRVWVGGLGFRMKFRVCVPAPTPTHALTRNLFLHPKPLTLPVTPTPSPTHTLPLNLIPHPKS